MEECAALCYKPLDVETLRELLRERPQTEDTLANVGAARDFVADKQYIGVAKPNVEVFIDDVIPDGI